MVGFSSEPRYSQRDVVVGLAVFLSVFLLVTVFGGGLLVAFRQIYDLGGELGAVQGRLNGLEQRLEQLEQAGAR